MSLKKHTPVLAAQTFDSKDIHPWNRIRRPALTLLFPQSPGSSMHRIERLGSDVQKLQLGRNQAVHPTLE